MAKDWNKDGVNSFLKKFNDIFKQCFKKSKRKIKLKSGKTLSWVTKGIKVASRMKRLLMPATRTSCDATVYKYKNKYVTIYRRVIRHAKKLTVQREIELAKSSSKRIWNTVNCHRNKGNDTYSHNLKLKIDNNIVDNPQDIAQIFSNNFISNGSFSNDDKDLCIKIMKNSTPTVRSNMRWKLTTPYEVYKIVRKMQNKKSYGYDDVVISVIKDNIDLLAEPISNFFNNCFNQGVFPDQLKIARVIPVYKKGPKNDPKNYRPISLLPIMSKIFEKVIKDRLTAHLATNSIISDRQFGYRVNVGTSDAIETLIDDAIDGLNKKQKVAGLFLDLSSAFDMIDHKILISKLEHYGVRGLVLQLLTSYLSNRYQYVELKYYDEETQSSTNFKSTLAKVKRGVPQGSILGPLFFIIFTNDLLNFIYSQNLDVNTVVYADDTNAIITADTIIKLENKTLQVLTAFNKWFSANNLMLNISKTNILLFKTTARNTDTLNINFDGNIVTTLSTTKFLGIKIDANLNWKEEVSRIEGKVSSACYAIRSLRDELTIEQLKIVYHALVESHLRYSIKFWGNSFKYNIDKAFIMQKRAIRTMVRIPQWESCREHFKILNILTVPCLYILVLLTDVVSNYEKFETSEDRAERLVTRTKNIKHSREPKLVVAQHCVRHQAVKLFNALPTDLKTLTEKNQFKHHLKRFLLKNCFYSIDNFIAHGN